MYLPSDQITPFHHKKLTDVQENVFICNMYMGIYVEK